MKLLKQNISLVKVFARSSLASLIKFISGIIVIKILSVSLGPAGLSAYNQFINVISIAAGLSGLGLAQSIVKNASLIERTESNQMQIELVSSERYLIIVSSMLTGLLVIIFSNSLNKNLFIPYGFDLRNFLIVFAFSIPLWNLNIFNLSVMNGIRKYSEVIHFRVLVNIAYLIGIVVFVPHHSINAAIISYILSNVVFFFFTSKHVKKYYRKQSREAFYLTIKQNAHHIKSFAFVGMLSVFLLPFGLVLSRYLLSSSWPLDQVGYWDALNSSTQAYVSLFTMALSVFVLPEISRIGGLKGQKNKLKEIIFTVLIVLIPAILFAPLIGEFAVLLLFSDEFIDIAPLFFYTFLLGGLRVVLYIIQMFLMAVERFRLFWLIEFVAFLVPLIISIFSSISSLSLGSYFFVCALCLALMLLISVFYIFNGRFS